ncbi:ribonucleotide reductase, partial [Earliella scabrosa]
ASEVIASLDELHPDYRRLATRIFVSGLHRYIRSTFSEWFIDNSQGKTYSPTRTRSPLLDSSLVPLVVENAATLREMIVHDRDFELPYATVRTLAERYLISMNRTPHELPQFMFLRVALAIHRDDLSRARDTYELLSRQIIHLPPGVCSKANTRNAITPVSVTCALRVGADEDIGPTLEMLNRLWDAEIGVGAVLEPLERTRQVLALTFKTRAPRLMQLLRCLDEHAVDFASRHPHNDPSTTIYIPIWHHSIQDVISWHLDASGARSRIQHIATGLLVPDVFMERLREGGHWTLFDPADTADLATLCGARLAARYCYYEAQLEHATQVSTRDLWNEISAAQSRTSQPGIVFSCTLYRKNNQRHLGPLRCADANMTSTPFFQGAEKPGGIPITIALEPFVDENKKFDFAGMREAAKIAIFTADSLVDLITYPDAATAKIARGSRPINVGVHGLADVYATLGLPYASAEARLLGMQIFESFYHTLLSESCDMSDKLGLVDNWRGSPAYYGEHYVDMWPVDTDPENQFIILRAQIVRNGLRHCMMISLPPMRVFPAIHSAGEAVDPNFSNLVTYKLPTCTFTEIRRSLVRVLEEHGVWNDRIAREIIIRQGSSLRWIKDIPLPVKHVFKTIWEQNPITLIEMASERAPFIDQSYLTCLSIRASELVTRVSSPHDVAM